jgi:hypothetical protein
MENTTIKLSAQKKDKVMKNLSIEELNSMKVEELKLLSKKLGIKGFSKMKKIFLIEAISENVIEDSNKNKKVSKIKKKSNLSQLTKDIDDLDKDKIVLVLTEAIEDSNWIHKQGDIKALFNRLKEKLETEKIVEKNIFIKNGGDEKSFRFNSIIKSNYDKLFFDYREKTKKHYKELEKIQSENLEKKLSIIEEIKKLIDSNVTSNSIHKDFKKIQQSWRLTGPVPRSKDQNVWQTYKHHVERFYDFIHLDRGLREQDFKYNYEEKLKIIENAEILAKETNIVRASRDLNVLHDRWKNDLGPVLKKNRDELWERFQKATKVIQKKRNEYQKDLSSFIKKNLSYRKSILLKMNDFTKETPSTHKEWQRILTEFDKLREEFKSVGYTPNKETKSLWKEFRETSKILMTSKNIFYKTQKTEHDHNILQKKKILVEINLILESDDWQTKINEIKKIAQRWKLIGFITRKIDKKLWDEFSRLNHLFFERLKSGYNKLNTEESIVFNKKTDYLEIIKKIELPENFNEIIEKINELNINWNKLGLVNNIVNSKLNSEYFSSIIALIKKVKINSDEKNKLIFETKILLIKDDLTYINDELEKINKKNSSFKIELNQLENNLDFFTNSSSKNPLFKEVELKISNIQTELQLIKERQIRLKQLKNTINKSEKKNISIK